MGPIGTISAQQALSLAAPSRLILEIDVGELLTVVVAHDEAGIVVFFDRPQRREAASRWNKRDNQ